MHGTCVLGSSNASARRRHPEAERPGFGVSVALLVIFAGNLRWTLTRHHALRNDGKGRGELGPAARFVSSHRPSRMLAPQVIVAVLRLASGRASRYPRLLIRLLLSGPRRPSTFGVGFSLCLSPSTA